MSLMDGVQCLNVDENWNVKACSRGIELRLNSLHTVQFRLSVLLMPVSTMLEYTKGRYPSCPLYHGKVAEFFLWNLSVYVEVQI